jgi:hypothetical protein
VLATLIGVFLYPEPKGGGAFVPNLLYRFDFWYKCASGTGIDVHFSTSAYPGITDLNLEYVHFGKALVAQIM